MSAESQYLSQCPTCSAQIDVSVFEPFAKIPCPYCQQTIRVRRKFDHFVIIKQIGEGGMSRVFEAEDETLGRRVALKILHRHFSLDQARMTQFQNEALITARVTHPNVIKLYSVGYDQGYFYIAMELVTGGSLEQRIKRDGQVPEKEALRIGRQVTDGLRAAYRMGLQHRDVKPANILFTDEGIAKVVDFGLALFVDHEDDSGEIWATPFYVSPEKVIVGKEDFRGDLFSLGATLYHALTGNPPHNANTNSIAELRLIKCRRVTLEDSGTHFAPRTIHIVDKLLALKPEDRPESYDSAVDELRLAEGLSDHEMVLGGYTRRRKLMIAAAAALVVAFVFGLIIPGARNHSNKPNKGSKSGSSEDDGGNSSTTVSSGITLAARFDQARTALRQGKVKVAGPMFEAILKEKVKDLTTLNKTRLNAALCSIISRDSKHAEALFREMGEDASDGKTLNDFFIRLGRDLGKGLGLGAKTATLNYDTRNEETLGFLAHGLAQWHLGDAKVGARDLSSFLTSHPRGIDLEWIELYHDLVRPYTDDIKLASTLGKPDSNLSREEMTSLLSETKKVLAALKSPGESSLRDQLNSRLKRLATTARQLDLAAQQATLKEQIEHYKREMEQFKELTESLPELVQDYDYSAALEVLCGMQFHSPAVQSALETKTFLYQNAADFLTTLAADFKSTSWTGRLHRRELGPVEGRVTSLDKDTLTLSLERGDIKLKTPDILPDTLVEMAESFLSKISDSDEYYKRKEQIAVFARLQGLQSEAEAMAKELIAENKACRMRWMRIMQGG